MAFPSIRWLNSVTKIYILVSYYLRIVCLRGLHAASHGPFYPDLFTDLYYVLVNYRLLLALHKGRPIDWYHF
jgi:hypothetical protein